MRHLHEGHNYGGVSEYALCGTLITHNYGWAVCGECLDKAIRMAQQRCEGDLPVTRRPNREKLGDFRLEFTS